MKECSKCKSCYEDEITVCPKDNEIPGFYDNGQYHDQRPLHSGPTPGAGRNGHRFRAKHKFLKSSHAIKIILPSLVSDDENLLVRFRQEAVLAASIDHPNVIRVTDFGVENDEMPYLVMEYIDGIPLSAYLKEDQPLPLEQAIELFLPVAEGVAEAHKKGIVHRDLKPQNIMVQRNLPLTKAVKVLDFGLAKIKSADSYPSLIQAKTMNIVGSPPYMSPEQWSGEGVDNRTDIYALAVILYQMLTGRLPFKADSMPAMMYQHLTVTPPVPSTFGVSLMSGVESVIFKGLEKDPQNRYPTMDLLLGDLDQAMGRDPSTAFLRDRNSSYAAVGPDRFRTEPINRTAG
jgi:serine/threonine-protein kinase